MLKLEDSIFFKFVLAHGSQPFLECEENGGFYSKAACIFVVRSNNLTSWDGLFSTCEQNGALPAHIYDTEDLMEHVWAYLLQNVRCIIFKTKDRLYNFLRKENPHFTQS